MDRREALKSLGIMTLASTAMLEVGCSSNALAELEKWVPVGLQAFAGVVAIVNPPAGSVMLLATNAASAAWAYVSAAIAAYQKAPSGTTLGKVEAVVGSLASNIKSVLALVPSASEYANTVTTALDLILATLSAIDAGLTPAPVTQSGTTARAATKAVKAAPVSVKDFRAQFNAIITKGGHPEHAI